MTLADISAIGSGAAAVLVETAGPAGASLDATSLQTASPGGEPGSTPGVDVTLGTTGKVDMRLSGLFVDTEAAEGVVFRQPAPTSTRSPQGADTAILVEKSRIVSGDIALLAQLEGVGEFSLSASRDSLIAPSFSARIERKGPVQVCADFSYLNRNAGADDPDAVISLFNGQEDDGFALGSSLERLRSRAGDVLLSAPSPELEAVFADSRCSVRRARP